METNHFKTIPLTVDEMIFANRNKAYGAYNLRTTYKERIKRAIIFAVFCFSVALAAPFINAMLQTNESLETGQKVVTVIDIQMPPDVTQKEKYDETMQTPEPPNNIQKFVPLIIQPDNTVPEDLPPTEDDLVGKGIGATTVNGTEGGGIENPLSSGTGTGTSTIPEEIVETPISIAQIMPQFIGGEDALLEYLHDRVHYPKEDIENNIQGTVYISFIIGKKGEIRDAKIMRGISRLCDAEALRVIKEMPNWRPGIQNGSPVAVSYVVPIKFKLQ